MVARPRVPFLEQHSDVKSSVTVRIATYQECHLYRFLFFHIPNIFKAEIMLTWLDLKLEME